MSTFTKILKYFQKVFRGVNSCSIPSHLSGVRVHPSHVGRRVSVTESYFNLTGNTIMLMNDVHVSTFFSILTFTHVR